MNITFKTRVSKNADPIITKAVLNWDGLDIDAIKKIAVRAIVIDTQSVYRASGFVPATDTINVSDMAKRIRGGFVMTPERLTVKVLAMSIEQKNELLKKLESELR